MSVLYHLPFSSKHFSPALFVLSIHLLFCNAIFHTYTCSSLFSSFFFIYVNLYLYTYGFTGLPIGAIKENTTDGELSCAVTVDDHASDDAAAARA